MPDPRRRSGRPADRRWWRRDNWYRDVWLLILSSLVLGAAIVSVQAGQKAESIALAQRAGRRVAIEATCAAVSAVIDAGRKTIEQGSVLRPPSFERRLERLGMAPRAARERAAAMAAAGYGHFIAEAVAQETGHPDLARPDGSLDCARLKAAAGVPR